MNGPLSIDDTIKLRAHLNELHEIAMRNLKYHPLPETDSTYLRGRIAVIEHLLAWVEPKPALEPGQVIISPIGNY